MPHVCERVVPHTPYVASGTPVAGSLWDLCLQGGEGASFETHTAFEVEGHAHTFVLLWMVASREHSDSVVPPDRYPHTATCPAKDQFACCTTVILHVKTTRDANASVIVILQRCLRCAANLVKIDEVFVRNGNSGVFSTYAEPFAYGRLVIQTIAELASRFAEQNVSFCELADVSRVDMFGYGIKLAVLQTLQHGTFSSYYGKYGFRANATLIKMLNGQLQAQLRDKHVRDVLPDERQRLPGMDPDDTLSAALARIRHIRVTEDDAWTYVSMLRTIQKALAFTDGERQGHLENACMWLATMRVSTSEFAERCRTMYPDGAVRIVSHRRVALRAAAM